MSADDDIKEVNERVIGNWIKGIRDVFIIKDYHKARVEMYNLGAMVAKKVFCSIVVESTEEEMKSQEKVFPAGSAVWAVPDGKGVFFQEATCLDERAVEELKEARVMMSTQLSNLRQELQLRDGQNRIGCFTSMMKAGEA